MASLQIPEIVRNRALLRGDQGQGWIDALPATIGSLEKDWICNSAPC